MAFPMVGRFGTLLLLAVSVLGAEPQPAQETKWDIESLARIVRPMRNPLGARLPLLLWNFPLPRDDSLAKLRDSGELRKALALMSQRGVLPTVEMGWEWTPAGALAMGRTLQDAGAAVNILIPQADMLEATVYKDCTVWGEGPDATRRNEKRKWPCLPLANPRAGAEEVRKRLMPFKEAGIAAAGVWFDDECLPHPWNGCYESQRDSALCKPHYPAGVLDNFGRFNEYVYALRSKLLAEVLADPVCGLFPKALAGNYGEFVSSKEIPFEGLRPPRALDKLVLMPAAYANTVDLPRHFKKDNEPVTQERADRFYFRSLLFTVSTCNANKRTGQLSMPYLSRYCPDNPDPRFLFGMTSPVFRELARHVWMRGADGVYVFNLGYPTKPQLVTPAASFESIEDIRAALDEWLDQREFLEKGQPLNFAVPELSAEMTVWSGLRLGERCLIRVFTFAAQPAAVEIEAFPDQKAKLEAPPQGATYLVAKGEAPKRL